MSDNPSHFKPGEPRPENAGRRAGTPNKATAQIRDAMAQTALEAGPMLELYIKNLVAKDPTGFDFRARHGALMEVLRFTCDRAGVGTPAAVPEDLDGPEGEENPS